MCSRDSCLQLNTWNSFGKSGNVFQNLRAPTEPSPAFFRNSKSLASAQCEPVSLNTADELQYLHRDLRGSFQLGILHLMLKELIRKITWLNNQGVKSRKCISTNSLIIRHFSVGGGTTSGRKQCHERALLRFVFLHMLNHVISNMDVWYSFCRFFSSVATKIVRRPIRGRLRVRLWALFAVTAHVSLQLGDEIYDYRMSMSNRKKNSTLINISTIADGLLAELDVAHRFDFRLAVHTAKGSDWRSEPCM